MRLTVELIQNSLSYINPLKERELDLRGAAKDHDAIDFTDNSISSLSNFPSSPRLRTLLLARNRVSHIQSGLATSIPNLANLILTANNFAELADLEPLKNFQHLTHLSLLDNPVTRKEHYRYWIIWLAPTVRFLDYRKVKDAEREKARELFGPSTSEPTPLASKIKGIKSSTAFNVDSVARTTTSTPGAEDGGRPIRVKLTPEERNTVKKMIKEAKSLQEIARLEKELNEGRIPRGVAVELDRDVEMNAS
ncbi:U2 snRNP complex subunit [Myotisia sp. PD_48]|nr:U2 snRNP complex subunit [Myotisia sp. PD_48]